jgi:murein L,D-transpeptidase YafK
MKNTIYVFILFTLIAGSVVLFLYRGNGRPRRHTLTEPAAKGKVIRRHFQAPLSVTNTDRILIEKKARRLTLFCQGRLIKTYRVALGREPVGRKTTEGDGRTPEGCYIIDYCNADSKFHLALHISYPNEADKRRAAARGVSPGSDIMIHGLMNGTGRMGKRHLARDWTLGCVAVTDKEIDEICRMAPVGTKVEIVP